MLISFSNIFIVCQLYTRQPLLKALYYNTFSYALLFIPNVSTCTVVELILKPESFQFCYSLFQTARRILSNSSTESMCLWHRLVYPLTDLTFIPLLTVWCVLLKFCTVGIFLLWNSVSLAWNWEAITTHMQILVNILQVIFPPSNLEKKNADLVWTWLSLVWNVECLCSTSICILYPHLNGMIFLPLNLKKKINCRSCSKKKKWKFRKSTRFQYFSI